MCGICGFWTRRTEVVRDGEEVLERMAATLVHRGPDASGTWLERDHGVGFGHRRLSIIDLSAHGSQPMLSSDARWAVTYNGEIYNFEEVRRELGDVRFRGHSDTEVLVEAIARWGVRDAVERFVGMFAFAAFDRVANELYLVRDRLGIKPLYYGFCAGGFVFGSELSALREFPGFDAEIDRDALASYMRYNCVPAPRSIFRGISKLEPGTILRLSSHGARPERRAYWNPREVLAQREREPFEGSADEATGHLRDLLRRAVKDRLVADVPLGAFLSGGVDSSLVVALMQEQTSTPVRTFSIGFRQREYDEARYAREVANSLGTDHTELYVEPSDALDLIPRLPELWDEPFADSSQIPTFLVSQLARRHVTVSLSGDGGDELFAGYNRHVWGPRVLGFNRRVPAVLRRGVAHAAMRLSPAQWDAAFGRIDPVLPDALRVRLPGDKIQKLAEVLPASSPEQLYRTLTSHWKPPTDVVLGARDEPLPAAFSADRVAESMMLLDLTTYLPNDILTKVDRASMGVSLEARVPLLDHRVVEFAWRLPTDLKLRDGTSKWILRQVLYEYVPRELIERPKMGFGVPIDRWLRGPLRDWAEELLDAGRLRREGYFRAEPIRQKWDEHLAGTRNWQHHLWDVLMFQAWLEH